MVISTRALQRIADRIFRYFILGIKRSANYVIPHTVKYIMGTSPGSI